MMHYSDLFIKNANVLTLESKKPSAEALAVKDGKVLALGRKDELSSLVGASTKIIDCEGKTLLPGFIDSHIHLLALAASTLDVDCGPSVAGSVDDILQAIKKKSDVTPQGEWIRAYGCHEFFLKEKRAPTRREMDSVAPHHPVRLLHQSRHACVLNSRALELAGIRRDSIDPSGSLVERDPLSGEPSGIVYGLNLFLGRTVLPPHSKEELRKGITNAARQLFSAGITSIHDATIGNGLDDWELFLSFARSGELLPRLHMMVGVESLMEFQRAGLAFLDGDDRLRLGCVKIELEDIGGDLRPTYFELREQVMQAHRLGYQVAVHAMEELAIEQAVDAIEETLRAHPGNDRRPRIEHVGVCPPDLLPRLAWAGIIVVPNPTFVYYNGKRYLADIDEDRLAWLYRGGSFKAAGIRMAAGSDSPVVPASVLPAIYSAVTRKTACGGRIGEEEGLEILEALDLFTRGGAFASFQEDRVGSIAPGKLADFVILDRNPLSCRAEELLQAQVEMTIVGGDIVWEKSDG